MIDVTTQMLEKLVSALKNENTKTISPKIDTKNKTCSVNQAIFGALQENPFEISKLKQALSALSSDTERGTGSFYSNNGIPEKNYWLAAIWAIASLNWPSGKDIARTWSKQSARYTEDGFEKAWGSYNPLHQNAIGIGSLYKRANELGLVTSSPTPSQNNTNSVNPLFVLLGINDLAALPPTEHLIKGILPSTGLSAIYGPSGSGKTFLALDLMMAVACQSHWFGHKVKNAPVVYVGLEGKGGINNRIQAWRIKNPSLTPSNFKIILNNFDLMKEHDVDALGKSIINDKMHQGLIVIDTLNQASPSADENSSQDMGAIIKHLKSLQEATGGLVLIVHHTGKNTAQGLRGHSSLKAALDANIEVTGGDKKSWLLEKSKDGEDGKSFGFRLEVQELGVDSDGDSITSCTVQRDHNLICNKPEPSGSQQKVVLKAIKEKLKLTLKMTIDEAVEAIKPTLTVTKSNQRNNRARTIIQGLINSGHLRSAIENDEGVIWMD